MANDGMKGFGKGATSAMKDFGFTGSLNDSKADIASRNQVKTRKPPSSQSEPINRPNVDPRFVRTTLADLPGPEQAFGVQPTMRRPK